MVGVRCSDFTAGCWLTRPCIALCTAGPVIRNVCVSACLSTTVCVTWETDLNPSTLGQKGVLFGGSGGGGAAWLSLDSWKARHQGLFGGLLTLYAVYPVGAMPLFSAGWSVFLLFRIKPSSPLSPKCPHFYSISILEDLMVLIAYFSVSLLHCLPHPERKHSAFFFYVNRNTLGRIQTRLTVTFPLPGP